jgi:hypothetical protein
VARKNRSNRDHAFNANFQRDETNISLQDYYLLPTSEITRTRVKRFRMTTRIFSNSQLTR